MAWLNLHFLGDYAAENPDGLVGLETAKTRALLVYLVMNPGPQPRLKLLGLLWGDSPEASAYRNLRHALWDLRRKLNLPGCVPFILSDKQSVEFNRKADFWLDTEQLQLEGSRLGRDNNPNSELQLVIDLYRGEFLDGFFVDGASAFEEWMLVERERLHTLALLVFQDWVTRLTSRGDYLEALTCSQKLLAIDPWREETHRQMMMLLAINGQRSAALAQYETCRGVLIEELGIEPSAETYKLYEKIRDSHPDDHLFLTPSASLPAQTTPFFGRETELVEITSLLEQRDCRLITITGPGGVGKTRLVVRAAAELTTGKGGDFPDGVFFIPLLNALSGRDLINTLAQTIRLTFFGQQESRSQLITHLAGKHIILVLDSFEHLLSEAGLVVEILRNCQSVKLLVTSRERLNIREEWVYPLEGLEVPPAQSDPSFTDGRAEDMGKYSAARLFLHTASRARFGFRLTGQDARWVARVCQLVDGLPLAVELAAAWVRTLSCEEIAREIERRLDFLVTTAPDFDPRHRSMRAVFEHSYALLTDEERQAFQRLSVFHGGVARTSAEQVTGVSLAVMTTLVDKSLLHRSPTGRYATHSLLQRFAAEKLHTNPLAEEEMGRRHCAYFASLLQQQTALAHKDPRSTFLAGLLVDLENLRSAWDWAAAHTDSALLEAMSEGAHLLCQITGSVRDGEEVFQQALQAFGWDKTIPEFTGDLLPWKLLAYQAGFQIYLGKLELARLAFERCLPVFQRAGAQEESARMLFFLGEIARFSGELERSRILYEDSLEIYRQILDQNGIGFCLSSLGLTATALKEYSRAVKVLEESRMTFIGICNPWGQAIASINLAALHKQLGEFRAGYNLLEESLAICRVLVHRWGIVTCLKYMAEIAEMEGDAVTANKHRQEASTIQSDVG